MPRQSLAVWTVASRVVFQQKTDYGAAKLSLIYTQCLYIQRCGFEELHSKSTDEGADISYLVDIDVDVYL